MEFNFFQAGCQTKTPHTTSLGLKAEMMFPDSPTKLGQFENELDPPIELGPPDRALDPLFDFLHAVLDRLQDLCEFLLACLGSLLKSWILQFTSGIVAGVLVILLTIRVFQLAAAYFADTHLP